MYNLDGKVALITGSANGIGRAIAERLAQEGCRVCLFDIDRDPLNALSEDLKSKGHDVLADHVDITSMESVNAGVSRALQTMGRIDFLINNAGTFQIESIFDTKPENFDLTLKVNVYGAFYCSKAVVPVMVERKFGKIVNISSWFGKKGHAESLAYCASKFALIGLTQSMAMDLAPHKINVNAICPGTIVNTKARGVTDAQARAKGMPTSYEREKNIPLGRVGQPEDVARGVAFLLSPEADYMTGQSMNMTGGLWMD